MEETTYGRLDAPIGSHIVTPRRGYLHHGIYVGEGKVVHYAGLCRGIHAGPVEEVTLSRFARGRPVRIVSDSVPNFDPQETVRRARSRLGEDRYRLLTNNCEHFCELSRMTERVLSGFGPNAGELVFRRGSRALCCGWAPTAAHCSDAGPEGRPVQQYLRIGSPRR
jgi:hypothetical protein